MAPNSKTHRLTKLIVVNSLVIVAVYLWSQAAQTSTVQLAVAKGIRLLDMPAAAAGYPAGYVLDAQQLDHLAGLDPRLGPIVARERVAFVSAVPLTAGEALNWREDGCDAGDCALVTYYDHESQATIETVVDVNDGQVVDFYDNPNGRPGGSASVLPQAIAVASKDPRVLEILGQDIGAMEPAMVPMSGWLSDGACARDWCVDLTFHDPAGTGRIFHVFVNLDRETVARTFFTRARADRSPARPLPQRNAFSDGCHEQYGWNLCWEMTANDGINFRDAAYNGQTVFTSAKIGQIEAWYPSWPGGYRDEIGFNASVPPFGGTSISDLGDGFEIRQTFTEFTRWPNCICCYRYEQFVRLFADGHMAFGFVSHGPGCDDPSVYRPFWRIDLEFDEQQSNQVWLFEDTQWKEMPVEFETFPVVDNLSPEGHKLATFNDRVHYRWSMERTDPLGLDEAYFFLLQRNENEGEGPITTGPGDTFIPPRQWINGDSLTGEDVVLWYVPLLYTKKGGPWWCMPDPEPEFSPCEAILHADPAGELRQPTAEELAALQPEAPTPTPQPTAALDATATPIPTPRPIEGSDAESIILDAGCLACHQIGRLGEGHKVGPDLTAIGLSAGSRVPGMTAEAYIRQSIVEPNAYLAPECPNGPCLPDIMPRNYGARLSEDQLNTLVSYLLDRRGPDPTPVVIGAGSIPATPLPKNVAAGKIATPAPPANTLPATSVGLLLIAVVMVISLALLMKGRSGP